MTKHPACAAVLLFLFSAAPAWATEIRTQEETLQGTILGKQGDEIFVETANGIVNIPKSDILEVDGKPYMYAPPKPVAPSMPVPVSPPPEGNAEQELKEYYDAHQEEFREPLKVHVRILGQAFFTRAMGEIRSDPTSEGSWRDGGWIEEGQAVEPFEESALRPVFSQPAGSVSPLLKNKQGAGSLFWVIERKESGIPPYEKVRPKVLDKILQTKTNKPEEI